MFAFLPTGLAPWEVVAFSGLCAVSALSIAITVGATVAYFATRPPRAARHPAPARATQPQPQMSRPFSATPEVTGATG